MIKVRHVTLICISGLIWFGVGCFLLQLGLKLLMSVIESPSSSGYPIIDSLSSVFATQQAVVLLIALSLFIGHFKGKYVLGKSVRRGVARILTFPNPTHLSNIYSAKYYILLGSMVLLGLSIKFFGLSNDVRGVVDVTIGAALINGALIYFRLALAMRKGDSLSSAS